MPYWLLMAMLIDYNVMNEREDKDKTISGSGRDLAKFM